MEVCLVHLGCISKPGTHGKGAPPSSTFSFVWASAAAKGLKCKSKRTLNKGKTKICLRQKCHHLQRLTSIGCHLVSNYLLVFVLVLSYRLFWGKKTNSTHRSTLCINVLFRTRPFSGLLSFVLNKTFPNAIQIHIPCLWSILFGKIWETLRFSFSRVWIVEEYRRKQ